ncbi:MAG: hypothetical protein IPN71_01385 [Fibrobacteres bacterium]|nr:hypothetical protein [Fibrobacterota bacterium]
MEADHDYDDTKLVDGKFYHAVFQRSKRGGQWRVRFIGSLGWGPEEQAGANWPSRLTLLSWALVPVFLCLHTRMASFAAPTQKVVGGTWQFLWYAIPNELRFQEGLTLTLYPALGVLLLAGGLSWIRWKWNQRKADLALQDAPGEYPLDKLWPNDHREDLRELRGEDRRKVKMMIGPRWFFAETMTRWMAIHVSLLLVLWSWPFDYEQKEVGSLDRILVIVVPLFVFMSMMVWRLCSGRLSMKISGEYRKAGENEAFIGSQIVDPGKFCDQLEEGVFYHVMADTHGEDGDVYSIEIAANHGWAPNDPMRFPLWTIWSLVMLPVWGLFYSRLDGFRCSVTAEDQSFIGLTPQGLRVGGYEFPLVTNLAGALTLAAYFVLLAMVSWGFLQGLRWAFRKWKARGSSEVDDLM